MVIARSSAHFLELARDLLARGHHLRFRAEGGSMHPTIRSGEVLVVGPVAAKDVAMGDILLYRTEHRLKAHRVVKIDPSRIPVPVFMLCGDAVGAVAERVDFRQVLGKVVQVERRWWKRGLPARLLPRRSPDVRSL